MTVFNRHTQPESEITSAPYPPSSGAMTTYPPDKKSGADTSRAEMGLAHPAHDNDVGDTDSGIDPKARDGVTVDAVWGRIDANGPNYRNLGWIRASVLEIKTQIGLGVLGLPLVLDTIGFLPGCLVIVAIAIIITWSDYVIGVFKLNHPEVYTLADAGYIMFGPVGREVIGFAFWLEQVAIAGAGLLSFSVALNSITNNATCTVVFVVVGAIINFLFSSIQTLDRISWIGWVGLVSIMASIITLAVSVGVGGRPADAPQEGPYEIVTFVTKDAGFVDAINAVSVVVLAYAGTPNFLNIVGEMRDQKNYTKSVITCQTFVTAVYLVIGCIVYHFTGQYIASPALGSAGILMKKICYGLAIPGLLVGCILYTHMPAKYIFVRILGKTRHLSENTPTHYIVWLYVLSFHPCRIHLTWRSELINSSCVLFNCIISFLIAEAIPFFNDLVGLIGALLGTFICIQTESYMWMWDNYRSPRTKYWWTTMSFSAVFFVLGWFLMIAGTYGSVVTINNSLNSGSTVSPFSCADNSGGS